MIKKIRVDDICPGVFICDFNCQWEKGNIMIDKMLVSDTKIIKILKSWDIEEVYIDTDRGRDVLATPAKQKTAPAKPSLSDIVKKENIRPLAPSPVPFSVEAKQALSLRNEASDVVNDMYNNAREGKAPNVDQTYDLVARMRSSIRRNHDALQLLTRIRDKDEYTLYHSISVASLILNVCDYFGLSEQRTLDIGVAAMFHDIGKMKVPHEILTKPSKLDDEEYKRMQKHVEYSVDLLQTARKLPLECYDIALHHHERIDGSGYPHGLEEEEIGFGAQVTSMCDVFDAVSSARCYKEALGTVAGLQVIYDGRDKHFNKELAHHFIRCVGVYPVGSCVQLQDDKVGIVAEQTGDMYKPVVKVYRDESQNGSFTPFLYDLSRTSIKVTGYADPDAIGIPPSSLLTSILDD